MSLTRLLGNTRLLIWLGFLQFLSAQGTGPFPFEGKIIDIDQNELAGIRVLLIGPDGRQEAVTDRNGAFSFMIRPGEFELILRHDDFIETRISRLEIPSKPFEPLLLMMPRIVYEENARTRPDPPKAPAPSLKLALVPETLKANGSFGGKVVLQNFGGQIVEVPVDIFESQSDFLDQGGLRLRLSVLSNSDTELFSARYVCLGSCKQLKQGESVSLPVSLDLSSIGAQQGGDVFYAMRVEAIFWLAAPSAQQTQPIRVKAAFFSKSVR